MKKNSFLIKILIIYLFLNLSAISLETNHFEEGIKFFEKKEFSKSKFYFERDLVFNPKNEKSYLYLAKIFSKDKDESIDEQEINLNNVLLLNPQNDEAIYMLTLIKIEQSNYEKAKSLIENFVLVCKSFCSKTNEINEKLEKIIPENVKAAN